MRKLLTLTLVCALAGFLAGASCPRTADRLDSARSPAEAEALFAQAEAAYYNSDWIEAIELYKQVSEDYPSALEARRSSFRIGECYLLMNQNEKAAEQFSRFVDSHRENSEVFTAQDYIIKIREAELEALRSDTQSIQGMASRLRSENERLRFMNEYLRGSVEAETVYLELDIEHDLLRVKMGTKVMYEYPIVSGKGAAKLKLNGEVRDFNTPRGIRKVQGIIKDPVWYRPNWYWHEKGEEVPEDIDLDDRAVEGALGPYKISIGEGYYIHGTRSGTITPGKFSHGCIRMNNDDLTGLVKMIKPGTMIYIY